jgi:hypothetical protein
LLLHEINNTAVKSIGKKPLGFGIEEAAIAAIKKMPNWTAAVKGEEVCRMSFTKAIQLRFN